MCTGVCFNGFSNWQLRKTSPLSYFQHFPAEHLGDPQDVPPPHPALVSPASCLPSLCSCPDPPVLPCSSPAPTVTDVSDDPTSCGMVEKDPTELPPPHPSCSSPPHCPLLPLPHLSSLCLQQLLVLRVLLLQ